MCCQLEATQEGFSADSHVIKAERTSEETGN